MQTVQFVARAGIIDLGWGHPDPRCLPVEAWREATAVALGRYGSTALTYGYVRGPAPLVEWLADRLARTDARPPAPDEVLVTAGASQALELLCAALTEPDDVVLVDAPTYHIALRILRDHRLRIRPAPTDRHGILPDETFALIRRSTRRVPLLYLVPTYANPTGSSLPDARRRALVEVAARTGTVLVEDDTYREMSYVGAAPPSLWSLGEPGAVVRVGSFAKSVAPGLRLGWLTGSRELVEALADRGYLDSGGGLNHTNALAMAEFGASGAFDRHLSRVRQVYAHRRDVLVAAVRRHTDLACEVPEGGWFLWLTAPVPADRLLATAEARGVSFLPGTLFHAEPVAGLANLRLSYSMLPEDELSTGARRLGAALRSLDGAQPG